jgi:uncharacterized protein with GYD domain
MLRHLVLLKWTPEATPDQIASVVDGLRRLPAIIPEIRRYDIGTDLALRDGTYDLALVAEFDDADAWRVYAGHPDHVAVIDDRILPILADSASVQHDLD